MKRTALLATVALLAATETRAQDTSAPIANPVSTTVKSQLTRFSKNMVAAAESMPAEKYGFKPSPEMNSFGHLIMHIVQSNNLLCSKISGAAAPDTKLADTDGKDKLVAGLKASFDFCGTALANVDDSKLGESMLLFGNRPASRAAALIALSDGWNDHYGAQAIYLRLNGILPPTAQPAPK
jgi:DinB superfamily